MIPGEIIPTEEWTRTGCNNQHPSAPGRHTDFLNQMPGKAPFQFLSKSVVFAQRAVMGFGSGG